MARINKVQVADPGVGFQLDITTEVVSYNIMDLMLDITVTDQQSINYYCKAVISNSNNNRISDATPSFIVPFGDTSYRAGQLFSVQITLSSTSAPAIYQTLNASNIPAQGGKFEVDVSKNYLTQVVYATGVENSLLAPGLLQMGEFLYSPSKNYICIMGADARLAIYNISGAEPQTPTWQSPAGAGNHTPAFHALLLSDGNFCIYDANMAAVWCAGTNGAPGPVFIQLTDSGVLNMYNGTGPGNTNWSVYRQISS